MKSNSQPSSALSERVHQRHGGEALAGHLLAVQEQERFRIAGEVHDDVLQSMIATAIQLELLSSRVRDKTTLALVEEAARSAHGAIEQLRHLLFELHPPALAFGGLMDSLRELERRYQGFDGPSVHLDSALSSLPSRAEATVLFRIAREALVNAHRHAKASRIAVTATEWHDGLELVVSDDGVGFDTDQISELPGHLGLALMAERAHAVRGWVAIDSRLGIGTEVRAWIPRLSD